KDLTHVAALPEQVNGDDRFRIRRDEALNLAWQQIEVVQAAVRENRLRPNLRYASAGRKEGETGQNHLVPWANSQCEERKDDRITTIAAAYGVLATAVFGGFLLELSNLRAHDVMGG